MKVIKKTVLVEGHKVHARICDKHVDVFSKFEGINCYLRIMPNGHEIPFYGGACASAITDRLLKGFFSMRA